MKESGYFLDLLKLDIEKYPVIAVVGGGGKTSLIYRLNEELQALGKKVIISTTTHMAFDSMLPRIGSDELDKLPQMLENHGFVAVADIEEASGKMCSIEAGKLQKLASLCDVMLIEADGAKHKPLKVPADWEPVIPEFADIVVSVIGLDCLGKARGQHIGERLFEHVKNEAKQKGCYEVTLNVWTGNISAEKFYEKMGMKTKEKQMEYIL